MRPIIIKFEKTNDKKISVCHENNRNETCVNNSKEFKLQDKIFENARTNEKCQSLINHVIQQPQDSQINVKDDLGISNATGYEAFYVNKGNNFIDFESMESFLSDEFCSDEEMNFLYNNQFMDKNDKDCKIPHTDQVENYCNINLLDQLLYGSDSFVNEGIEDVLNHEINKKFFISSDSDVKTRSKPVHIVRAKKATNANKDLQIKKNKAVGISHACNQCPKSYKYRFQLEIHTRSHTGDRPFICNVCEKGFSSKNNLQAHLKRHSDGHSYECPICSKSFRKGYSLRIHNRVHTREKPVKCEECNKEFFSQGNLNKHMRLHTGDKPFVCDICDERFAVKIIMQCHRNWHATEKPFKCNVCDKGFVRKETFKVHLRRHDEVKPFSCELCLKGYCTKFEMHEHMASHTTEHPFSCSHCRKSFKTMTRLRNHRKFHCSRPAWN